MANLDALEEEDLPDFRIHDAEQCYIDTIKIQELELLDKQKFKNLVKNTNNSQENNKIISQFTSPLYLANLTLGGDNEIQLLSPSVLKDLAFKVLETPSPFDQVACDQLPQSPKEISVSEKVELLALRKNKKLHEKADHLLGRSFRNCVMHSQQGQESWRRQQSNKPPI